MERRQLIEQFLSLEGITRDEDPKNEAIFELDRLAHAEPEVAWALILEILAREPSQRAIAALAAGPLEDLIDEHGPQFIERIELLARRDPKFRHLLGGVWESSTSQIWARVEAARVNAW